MSKPVETDPIDEPNTMVFGHFVIYENVCFDVSKLPSGDENLIPALDFYRMMVEAADDKTLTLERIMLQARKMGYTY